MIITNVRFPTNGEPLSVDAARDLYLQNAASYLEIPGLLFKAYIRGDDGAIMGGTYWWADRASAEGKFNDGWRAGMAEKYGADPMVEHVEALVVVDPRSGKVITEPPTQ